MNVQVLEQFLSSLGDALRSVGAGRHVDELVAVLEPYRDWDTASFTQFLKISDAYRKEGNIRMPVPEDEALRELANAFAAIRKEVSSDAKSDASIEQARRDAIATFAKLGDAIGLKITAKVDAKWLERQRVCARAKELAKRMRILAGLISGAESYSDPSLEAEMEYFVSLDTASWKALDQSLGTNAKGKGRDKVEGTLAELTGIPVPSRKSGKKAKATFAPEQIMQYAQQLKSRMERSNDRESFPRSEVEAQIAELSPLSRDLVYAVLREANFEVKPDDSKPVMLKALREFLDAGHRAFERIQA